MNAFFNDWLWTFQRKAGMVRSAAMVLALLPATGAPRAEVGSTGQPRSWVQIGETKDTVLQIDTNSITGFESPAFGMAHRSDYRFKGKTSDRLTSRARTAFMVQKECDEQKGSLTIFSTGPQGNPVGKAESFDFELGRGTWPDAVAATMCKARKLMMDNQRVNTSPPAGAQASDRKDGDPATDWNFLLGLCTYETSNTSESGAIKPITECSQAMLRSLPPYQSITYEIWAPDSSLNLMYLGNVPEMPFNPKFVVQFRSTVRYDRSPKANTILVTSRSDGCGQVQEFTLVGGRLSKREVAMIDEGCDPQTVRLAKQGAAQRSKPTELGYLRMK